MQAKYPKEEVLIKSLFKYNMNSAEWVFISHNENIIYKVKYNNQFFCYRLHLSVSNIDFSIYGSNFHSLSSLRNEMEILNVFAKNIQYMGDKKMQTPIKNIDNEYISIVDNIPITVLKWVDGIDFDSIESVSNDDLISIGELIGNLHNISKSTDFSNTFDTYIYNQKTVERMQKKIEFAHQLGIYDESHYITLKNASKELIVRMNELNNFTGSFGLIHADLSKSNILKQNNNVVPIDFCLCGYGYYYQDLGNIFLEFYSEREQQLICNGYFKATGIYPEKRYTDAFMVYHTLLYLSCNISNDIDISWLPTDLFAFCTKGN